MEEKSVDKQLENFLERPINDKGSKTSVEVKDEVELSDDEEELPDTPSTNFQRDSIYRLLEETSGKGLPPPSLGLVDKVRKLSSKEADSYIECLRVAKDCKFSEEITKRIMTITSGASLYPGDEETMKIMEGDDVMVKELNVMMGDIFSKLGRLKGPFMYGCYILHSWLRGKRTEKKISNVKPEQKRDNDGTTLPIDGSSTVANGKNKPND